MQASDSNGALLADSSTNQECIDDITTKFDRRILFDFPNFEWFSVSIYVMSCTQCNSFFESRPITFFIPVCKVHPDYKNNVGRCSGAGGE